MEKEYEISSCSADDFYMFRYEINSIFQKHLFQGEDNKDLFLLGQKPLSQFYEGVLVKEKVQNMNKQRDILKANNKQSD